MVQVLEITTQIGCVNGCSYCPQDRLLAAYAARHANPRMSFDVFKACVDKVPVSVDIHFTGMCEPWMNPECTRMLLYAHKKGHKIRVATTLAGMGEEDIAQFKLIPFRGFEVHLPSVGLPMNIKITENYLDLIRRIASGSIINLTFRAHGTDVLPSLGVIIANEKKQIIRFPLSTRAGNVQLSGVVLPYRKKKVLGCIRHLRQNVLLPNGDVVLCCMDYGMRHVLGNLLACDYADLFTGEEFLKVKRGLWCDSADILCKYCDGFTYETVLSGKIWPFLLKNKFKMYVRG